MALTSTDKQVSSLIINKVPSEDVYQQMIAQNLVNDNEIYIVQDNDKTTIDPATTTPKANGTASAGTSLKYAREDHVHPKQEIPVTSVNGKTGAVTITSGDGKVDIDNPYFTSRLNFGDKTGSSGGYLTWSSGGTLLSGSNVGLNLITAKGTQLADGTFQPVHIGIGQESNNIVNICGSSVTINGKNPIKNMRKLTLSAANWSTSAKIYTATVNGILEDVTKQSIEINPIAKADNDNAVKFGIYPTAQGANSITFSCDTIPTTAINFYITYQDVNYLT